MVFLMLYMLYQRQEEEQREYATTQEGIVPSVTVRFTPPDEMEYGRPLEAENLAFRVEFTPNLDISTDADEFLTYDSFTVTVGGELSYTWDNVTIPSGIDQITARVIVYLWEDGDDVASAEEASGASDALDDGIFGLSELGEIDDVTVDVGDYDQPTTPPPTSAPAKTITIGRLSDDTDDTDYGVFVKDDRGQTVDQADLTPGDSFSVDILPGYMVSTGPSSDIKYLMFGGDSGPVVDDADNDSPLPDTAIPYDSIVPGEEELHVAMKFGEPSSSSGQLYLLGIKLASTPRYLQSNNRFEGSRDTAMVKTLDEWFAHIGNTWRAGDFSMNDADNGGPFTTTDENMGGETGGMLLEGGEPVRNADYSSYKTKDHNKHWRLVEL